MMENERDEQLPLELDAELEKLRDENLSRDEFIDECTKLLIKYTILKEPGLEAETGFLNCMADTFKEAAIEVYTMGA